MTNRFVDKDGKKVRLKKDGTPDRRSPPKEHQFKPGQSGHARGRPPKRKSPAELLDAAAQERVRVDGKLITLDELAFKQLVIKAGKGDLRAIALMNALRERSSTGAPAETPQEAAAREEIRREFVEFLHAAFEPLKPFEACGLCVWGGDFKATMPKWVLDGCLERLAADGTIDHGERAPVSHLPLLGGPPF